MEDEQGLIPFLRGNLVDKSGFEVGFNPVQLKALQTIQTNYLRQNKIQASWLNRKETIPLIERCIKDGLASVVGRREIQPHDDLTVAFNAGLALRKAKLDQATEMVNYAYKEGLSESHLALNEGLIKNAYAELKTAVLRAELPNADRVIAKGEIREGVLTSLIGVAREKAEELVPGSKKVKLSITKEAGLVRNMLFSYMTTGEANPLIEIQDIVAGRDIFSGVYKDFTTWVEFCNSFDINYHDGNEYIADLVLQIQAAFNKVPVEIKSVDSLGLAYKVLGDLFTIDNPFNRLERLSDDPYDQNSIWDENHSRKIQVENRIYRVPVPQALALYAHMIVEEDPQKSNILTQNRVPILQSTIEELEKPLEEDPEIKRIDKMITEITERSAEVGEVKKTSDLPDFVLMKPERIAELEAKQIDVTAKEIEFFPLLRRFMDEERELIVDALKRHANGELAASDEMPILFRIQAAPVFAQATMRLFTKLAAGRIEAIEAVFAFANNETLSSSEGRHSIISKYFDEAKKATIITLLERRSQKWIEDANAEERNRFRSQKWEEVLTDAISYRTILHPGEPINTYIGILERNREARELPLFDRGRGTDSVDGVEKRQKRVYRYTHVPGAATEVLLLSLARMIPGEFWPASNLNINDFLRGRSLRTGRSKLWSISNPNNRLEAIRIANLRGIYREALGSLGFQFADAQVAKALSAGSVMEMASYAIVASNLFGVEKAFNQWSEGLLATLHRQAVSNPKILAERFTNFNPALKTRLASLQDKRQIALGQARGNRERLIIQLQNLGLALPEEHFQA